MKPYAEYKSTGLNWLPEVPSHWRVEKLRHMLKPFSEKGHPDAQLLSVVREKGVIVRDTANDEENHNFIPDDLSGYKFVKRGQFAMNKMKAWQGSYGVSDHEGIVSPAYFVFDLVSDVLPSFFHVALRSKSYVPYFGQASDGIRVGQWDLSLQRMKEIPFVVPPPDEQAKIVAYLDAKTAKIDRLIKLKEREIELLQEGVVKKATDCQNDHARKLRIKRLFSLVREPIIREPNTMYSPVGVLNRGRGIFHKDCVLGKDLGDSEFFKVTPGDLLISGQFAWEGSFALLQPTEEGCVASHRYYSLRSHSNEICNEYLWAFFQTQKGNLIANLCSHGAAGRNKPLNIGELMNVYIPIPTKAQQDDIRRCCARLRVLRSFKHNFVRLLQEYRTRLISDAVTGRIDLREVS